MKKKWKITVFLVAILLIISGIGLCKYPYSIKEWNEGYWDYSQVIESSNHKSLWLSQNTVGEIIGRYDAYGVWNNQGTEIIWSVNLRIHTQIPNAEVTLIWQSFNKTWLNETQYIIETSYINLSQHLDFHLIDWAKDTNIKLFVETPNRYYFHNITKYGVARELIAHGYDKVEYERISELYWNGKRFWIEEQWKHKWFVYPYSQYGITLIGFGFLTLIMVAFASIPIPESDLPLSRYERHIKMPIRRIRRFEEKDYICSNCGARKFIEKDSHKICVYCGAMRYERVTETEEILN